MKLAHVWARPLHFVRLPFRYADHTWITTYAGPYPTRPAPPPDFWYCWGDAHEAKQEQGVRLLACVPIDLRLASCLAQPNIPAEHGGIMYGIDGVCHQMANRILFAARGLPTVSDAQGYEKSYYFYDTYGTNYDEWELRKERCGLRPRPPSGERRRSTLSDRIHNLFRSRLGPAFPEDYISRVEELDEELSRERSTLDDAVRRGQIHGAQYADQLNSLFAEHLRRVVAVIGPEAYETVFGERPGDGYELVDPVVAERFYSSDRGRGGSAPPSNDDSQNRRRILT